MNNQRILLMMAILVSACLVGDLGQAQVVREDGADSIAGVLDTAKRQVSWTFRSAGMKSCLPAWTRTSTESKAHTITNRSSPRRAKRWLRR